MSNKLRRGDLPLCWQEADKAGGVYPADKEWKFTLDQWHELPDIPAFVGSTFIINRIDMKRTNMDNFRYDIYIAPLPQHNPLSVIYKSVMDVAASNKKRRKAKKKSGKSKKKR